MTETLYWIWLSQRPGLGPVRVRKLLELVGDPGTLYAADGETLARLGLPKAACVTVIGSEGQGVCEAFLSAAAREAVIPMSPRCESLNAAVAATVILWELRRDRK